MIPQSTKELTRRLILLPSFLHSREKKIILFAAIATLVSGLWLFNYLITSQTQALPARGGSLREGIVGELNLPNPILAQSSADQDVTELVYAGLMDYNEKGEIVPALAEKVDTLDDGKSYLFTLRQNLRWADGKPLTADDVVFTIKLLQDPRTKSPFRTLWQGVEVIYVDETRIKFTLREPYVPFLENATVGILPKHLWEEILPQNILLAELNLKPIGAGPFQFASFTKNQTGSVATLVLKRNSYYFQEGPYVGTIELRFYPTMEQMMSAWRKGEIDSMATVGREYIDEIENHPRLTLHRFKLPRVTGVFFNQTRSKVLAQRAVREALTASTFKEDIIAVAIPYRGSAALSPLPEAVEGFIHISTSSPSLEMAREILEQDGWKDEDGDGVREKKLNKKDKEALNLEFDLVTATTPELTQTAEILRATWEKIGIRVNVRNYEIAELSETYLRPRNYDAILFGQAYTFIPDPYLFWHSSQKRDPGLNISLYDNPEVDKVIEQMRKSVVKEDRLKDEETFQKMIMADIPAIFLYYHDELWAHPAELKGVTLEKTTSHSRRFTGSHLWYIKTKRAWK